MRRRTPLERVRAAKESRDAAMAVAREKNDAAAVAAALAEFYSAMAKELKRAEKAKEDIERAIYDPSLSWDQRLKLFKSAKDLWPRMVLGMYEAELEAAQKEPNHGQPSDRAYQKVAKYLGLREDHIQKLCNEGRLLLQQGMSATPKEKMLMKEFVRKYYRPPRSE